MNAVKVGAEIQCPHCGIPFSPDAVLEKDVRRHLEQEYEQRLEERAHLAEQRARKVEEEKYSLKLRAIESDRQDKALRLNELEKRYVAFEERERVFNERQQNAELALRKKMLSMEREITEKAEQQAKLKANLELSEKESALQRRQAALDLQVKQRILEETGRVREEEQMRTADLQKKLDDQTRMINEMKRKSEQGSMQAQGEVQEIAIEEFLEKTFIKDVVEEVAKGKRGGDCVHHVRDQFGNLCGKILYESKRTKVFGGDWSAKLKEDMRLAQADIGVIVTEVLPTGMHRFGEYEGVWVCSFSDFKSVCLLLRDSVRRVGEVRAAQENKGEKMQMLYNYLTNVEFKQKIEGIVESFQQMQLDLIKEKNQAMSRWARTEKHIFKVMENTVSLYGDVRGIAGSAVKQIAALEMGDESEV